jgi:polar amino acid transport system permease protein
MQFSVWDIVRNLLLGARWTVGLSLLAFLCGGCAGALVAILRTRSRRPIREGARLYIELFQGTPLLMQLFLIFFGLPLIGISVEPWGAAAIALTLSASAYLGEIWRGCIEAVPAGQWDAAAALGLHELRQLQLVVLPQALRIAVPPTVGYLVQLVKSTALTSIIGFQELMKTANAINNATFEPFTTYGIAALIYFVLCYPLSLAARGLERRLRPGF